MTLMYHIIVNKKSRSGRGEKLWPVIEGELERRRTASLSGAGRNFVYIRQSIAEAHGRRQHG